jgi:hypothetical protein
MTGSTDEHVEVNLDREWHAPKLTVLGDAAQLVENQALVTNDGNNGSS